MKTRLLKRLRKEAYEHFGATCRIEFGVMHYHVDTRKRLKEFQDGRNEYKFHEIEAALRSWRRKFIKDRISKMREEQWLKDTKTKIEKL